MIGYKNREGLRGGWTITDRATSIAFFTLVLLASIWYHIKKVKQRANKSENKWKDVASGWIAAIVW